MPGVKMQIIVIKREAGIPVNNAPFENVPRRKIANVNLLGTTQLHTRNPYIVAIWSALFPGFGHLLLSKYLRAYILFLWEILINLKAHVNLTIFYTILGKFDTVKEIVDIRWSLLYVSPYIFAVWDSYRAAVDLNKHYILASREDAPINPFVIEPFGISYLDKRSPLVTSAWCALTPGLGHIMIQRFTHGLFVFFWWILIIYCSNALTAIHLTFLGDFKAAGAVIDKQWFLNIPSVFFFCIYTTYVNSVESNKLFEREQSQFLRANYQSPEFPFPPKYTGAGENMYITAAFKQSIEVELAITAMEEAGINKREILAVPIEMKRRIGGIFDTMRSSTGDSMFDLPMILAAFLALFGSIYGFVLNWGPVVWGVIGAAAGFAIGFLIKLLIIKSKVSAGFENEVVILISCEEHRADTVKKILKDNGALGVSIVKGGAA